MPSSLFVPSPTAVLARAQSLVADVSPPPQSTHDLRGRSSNASIHSQASVSSSSTECSFHTAVDDKENDWDQTKILQPLDSPFKEPGPQSWVEAPLSTKHEWSDSSISGFRSSAFEFTSRGGQSSADTVVSPADDAAVMNLGKEYKFDNDEWPVSCLTTITRQELDEYENGNKTQEKRRRFTWGRKQGQTFLADKEREASPGTESGTDVGTYRRKSRKLKKKRPDSQQTEEGITAPVETFDTPIISIYIEGEAEEFDPLKGLPTHEGPVAVPLQPDEPTTEAIAISTDDPVDVAVEATLNGHDDEWEDMESADHRYASEEDDQETWLDDAILRSRTPQEILQGLDVVHEEEEEDSTSEVKLQEVTDSVQGAPGDLEKRESYPFIGNKGKEKQGDDGEMHRETIDEQEQQAAEGDVAKSETLEAPAQPTSEQQNPRPPRRKLSKRRRSRRKLDTDSPPPLPERITITSKQKNKNTNAKGEKRDHRRRTVPTTKSKSKKPSVPTLRPRRTPKTVLSSVRFHVFRPLSSFALLFGIDVANGRRLSQELRTPNALLVGRHFSEKHIPRFPSRLDGVRTSDKKVARYD